MPRPIAVYLPLEGYWGHRVTLTQTISEGYPTGEYSVEHLTRDNLQQIADYLIGLPPELYAHVEGLSRNLERILAKDLRHA